MMAISNNFAGTPVTRVEKDDGTIAVLKGFTKEEFDTTFGLGEPAKKRRLLSKLHLLPHLLHHPLKPLRLHQHLRMN